MAASERPYEPKPGPGQVFLQELIDAQSGHAKRFRNIGGTALSLAYHRGQLAGPGDDSGGITAEDRYAAGQRFERLWYLRESSGINPLECNTLGQNPYWWNDRKARASLIVQRLRERMYGKNFLVVQRFCGEGHAMTSALRGAMLDVHPNSTASRVREALDDLVEAMTGRRSQ